MFGKNLKYYRLKNNMTKKALSEAIGVTPMAITNYENNERQPSMDTIKKLAEVLNIRVTDFLENNGSELVFTHVRQLNCRRCCNCTLQRKLFFLVPYPCQLWPGYCNK